MIMSCCPWLRLVYVLLPLVKIGLCQVAPGHIWLSSGSGISWLWLGEALLPLATVDGGLDTPGHSWWMFYNPRREVQSSCNPVREK